MKNFFYRVTAEDTLTSVCKRFSVPIGKLIKCNNLNCEIAEGDMLYIEKSNCRLYKVLPHDTLKSISARFNVPGYRILEDNAVPYIFYGLVISIPD
jgi:spore germination protein YaaH